MGRTLIKGGTVVSLDRAVGNHQVADVLIDDGVIAEVGPSVRARGADVVDAAGTIVMPGFVDANRPLALTLQRSTGLDSAAAPVGASTPDDLYAATFTGLLQSLAAGTTTVVDWCDVGDDRSCLEAVRAAHADSGARTATVASEAAAATQPADAVCSPDVVAGELDRVAEHWARARAAGRRIHARAGTADAAGGEVAELGRRGLLGADVTLVHCVRLTGADFDAVAAASASVVLTPAADMAAGVGRPPMQQLIDRGIRPGLGVGDVRLAPGDVFAQMRAAISVQHGTLFDLKLAGKGGIPNLLGTRDVIRYATSDGARTAGLADAVGSLTPGKRADVLVLRADRPNIAPINDAIGAVVWGMDTSNIDWVFVDGVARLAHGELTGGAAEARRLVADAQRRLAALGVTA